MFRQSSMLGMRALICMVLAVTLMIFDQKSVFFQQVRADLSMVVLPVQYLVNGPIKTVHWVATSVTTQQELLADNARLRAHELLLESRLQKLLALERENAQLRELLKSTPQVGGHVMVAQLLAVDLDPNLQQVIVDKGSKHNIYVGQPVLDAFGVIGQVVHADPLTSRVMLISDRKSAVPVQDSRNGIRAIAMGVGSLDKLSLINVPDTSDIQVGDLFVCSGLDRRFPVGYPVGVVKEIRRSPTQRFASITLLPSAHLNQSQQVLMSWPNKALVAQTVQRELTAPSPKKTGK